MKTTWSAHRYDPYNGWVGVIRLNGNPILVYKFLPDEDKGYHTYEQCKRAIVKKAWCLGIYIDMFCHNSRIGDNLYF